jgi:hypothetical protein
MAGRDDPPTPHSPEARRQAELRRAAEEKERQILERAVKFKEEHGQDVARRVQFVHEIGDAPAVTAAVDVIARDVAEGKRDPKRLSSGNIEEAIGKAQAAKDAEARADEKLEAEKVRQADLAAQEKAREQAARAAQEAAARARQAEPIPGAVERFNATLAQSKANQAQVHAANIDHIANSPGQRPNYTRFEDMKREQEAAVSRSSPSASRQSEGNASQGEISDAKAARLSKLEATFKAADERAASNQQGRTTGGKGGAGRGGA